MKHAATREMLRMRLGSLAWQIDAIETEARLLHEQDSEELATEREIEATSEVRERQLLAEAGAVRAALLRIAAGSYGLCTRCGDPIAEERLKALPEAAYCLRCAALAAQPRQVSS